MCPWLSDARTGTGPAKMTSYVQQDSQQPVLAAPIERVGLERVYLPDREQVVLGYDWIVSWNPQPGGYLVLDRGHYSFWHRKSFSESFVPA